MRLAEPEDSLFFNSRVGVVLSHLDEQRNAFVLRHLREREDGTLLYVGIGIVIDCVLEEGRGLLAGLLRQPEDGLLANLRRLVLLGNTDQLALRFGRLA